MEKLCMHAEEKVAHPRSILRKSAKNYARKRVWHPQRWDVRFLCWAGNVNFKASRYAVNQLGRNVVLTDNLDRLGKFNAPLVDLKTLRGQALCNIAGGNRAK